MSSFSLLIDNKDNDLQAVDLFGDETITLTRQVKDLLDLTSARTDFTQQFTIASSPTNDGIFENYFDENTELTTWNAFIKKEAEIHIHSIPIFTGVVELRGVKFKEGLPQQYNIIFYGEVKNALTLFGEDTLIDVDWTKYDHIINDTNIQATWNQTFVPGTGNAGDILYPIIDWQKGFLYSDSNLTNNINNANSGISINDFRPAIRLKSMIANVFDKIGFTIGGTLLSQPQFDDIYVAPMGQAEPLRNPTNTDSNVLITNGALVLPAGLVAQKMALGTVVTDVLGLWSLVNDEYTCPFNGSITFKITIDVIVFITRLGFGILKNNSRHDNYADINGTGTFVITTTLDVAKGDKIALGFITPSGATVDNVRFETTNVDFGIDGATIDMSSTMPQIRVSDFVNNFLKIHNAVIIPNGVGNFDIHNIDDWYDTGTTLNWTRFLDTKEIDHEKLEIPKTVSMNHKEGKDLSNQAFISLNGRKFGGASFSPEVDFASNQLTLESIFTIPTPIIMRKVSDLGQFVSNTDLQMVVMLDGDYKPVIVDLLMFFYAGKQAITSKYYLNGIQQSFFPLISPYQDNPTVSGSQSLTFGLEATFNGSIATETLFVKYWQRYLSRLYSSNSRLVKVAANIPVKEWLNLEMNDTIGLSANYYKIMSIQYDILNEIANLELITYQDVDIIGWTSASNLPNFNPPTFHPVTGKTFISDEVTGRDVVNGRIFNGTIYATLNNQTTYDDMTVKLLRNQLFKTNKRIDTMTAFEDTPAPLALTGVPKVIPLSQTQVVGDSSRYTFDNAADTLRDNFGGQFKVTAEISFEQVGLKTIKFYIDIDGVESLAKGITFGDSAPISLSIETELLKDSRIRIMAVDVNAEVHSIDVEFASLTIKVL